MRDLPGLITKAEKGITEYIVGHVENMKFDHPHYEIKTEGPDQFDITLSLTGMGEQFLSIAMRGDEFQIKGKKVIEADPAVAAGYPTAILTDLVQGIIHQWITSEREQLAPAAAPATAGSIID
jgi:hypothetical protein